METIDKVIENLKKEGIDASLEGNDFKELCWIKDGRRHYIYQCDIAENNDCIAWLQSSDADDHLLVVYQGLKKFCWVPKTYNPVFGCDCIYIGWRENYLVFVYLEKHDIYICTISGEDVKTYNFHGQDLFIGDELVSYSSYRDARDGSVKIVSLDKLEKLEVIDVEQATKRNIKPVYYQDYMR